MTCRRCTRLLWLHPPPTGGSCLWIFTHTDGFLLLKIATSVLREESLTDVVLVGEVNVRKSITASFSLRIDFEMSNVLRNLVIILTAELPYPVRAWKWWKCVTGECVWRPWRALCAWQQTPVHCSTLSCSSAHRNRVAWQIHSMKREWHY